MIELTPPLSGEFELKVGDNINVGFLLPEHDDYLQVSSEVVWIKYIIKNQEGIDSTYIGAKFIVLTEEIEDSIKRFVDDKLE